MVTAEGNVVDEIHMSEAAVEAENQSMYLSYKKNEFLHFHGDVGPIQIPWKYVLKREVVDTDSGEILDLDKEIATRSEEYMCRQVEGGPRNITTKFWWYRDKNSVKLGSNERQHIWKCESKQYVIAPTDCPCEEKQIMRITTWDQNGQRLKDAETPTASEQARYVSPIGPQDQTYKITTRIIYYVPPEDGSEQTSKEAIAWTYTDEKPPVENKRSGWTEMNDSWIHTA